MPADILLHHSAAEGVAHTTSHQPTHNKKNTFHPHPPTYPPLQPPTHARTHTSIHTISLSPSPQASVTWWMPGGPSSAYWRAWRGWRATKCAGSAKRRRSSALGALGARAPATATGGVLLEAGCFAPRTQQACGGATHAIIAWTAVASPSGNLSAVCRPQAKAAAGGGSPPHHDATP